MYLYYSKKSIKSQERRQYACLSGWQANSLYGSGSATADRLSPEPAVKMSVYFHAGTLIIRLKIFDRLIIFPESSLHEFSARISKPKPNDFWRETKNNSTFKKIRILCYDDKIM